MDYYPPPLLDSSQPPHFVQWQESRDGAGVEGRHWAASWANAEENAQHSWVFHSGKNESTYEKTLREAGEEMLHKHCNFE
jgi:hypothetical protein